MYKYIILFCIIAGLLCFCKIIFQLQELMAWKKKTEQEQKVNQEREQNMINNFLNISKKELAIMKFLFHRKTKSAWLPCNLTEAILLTKKHYIKIIQSSRKSMEMFNFYINQNDILYSITPETLNLINKYKSDVTQKFKSVHYDKILNKYQV